jgi:hypothetical protein
MPVDPASYPVGKMTEAVTPEPPSPAADVLFTLSDGTKVKQRLPRMRACNERNAKGKLCAGHLKRWYHWNEPAKERFGSKDEIYRCERCHTIYLPNPGEAPRTGILAW